MAKVREALAAAGVDHSPYSGHKLQKWSSYNGSEAEYWRRNSKDARSVEKQCLSAIRLAAVSQRLCEGGTA